MPSFSCDYNTGAHEKILSYLAKTNLEPQPGYGEDAYSLSAKDKIRSACHKPEADVYFISGGTQTNALVIDALLKRYEGVVAVDTGHVSVHEAGAIEYTGHKVLTLPHHEGKMQAEDLSQLLQRFYQDPSHTHMVFPGMVYLSYPTEYGTLYQKSELQAIYQVCRAYKLPLFIDGARLGYGLMSEASDLSLPELADLCDVFYIGGTKVGALCGEAIVFSNISAPKHFITHIKQHGALLAKGRLLGAQFDVLFSDELYFKISKHAITMAQKLKTIFAKHHLPLLLDSPTNQQFIIVEDALYPILAETFGASFWEKADEGHTVVRFVTSWSTTPEDIEALDQWFELHL